MDSNLSSLRRNTDFKKKILCKEILGKIVRKCLTTLKKQTMDFCLETGLHGYKYIAETHRPTPVRVAWAVIVITFMCIALVIIKFTFDFYTEHQVSTVIESTQHGIWNYPFPAVTLCNINRMSVKLTWKLAETLKLPPDISKEFIFEELSLLNELLYPGKYQGNIQNNLTRLQSILDRNDLSIPTAINSVTEPCENFLAACVVKSIAQNCSDLFEMSYTREGICCSYNYITVKQITENNQWKPVRSASCGYKSGLGVKINLKPDDYHSSILGSVGVKVMLHDPYTYPDFDAPAKLIGIDKYSFLTVKPEKTYSTPNVKSLPLSKRPCIFSDESTMIEGFRNRERNFATAKYSFENCMAQCRATVIKAKCGCIPYYYPQNGTRICNLRDVECMETYKSWFETSWPGTDMSPRNLPYIHVNTKLTPCGCRPDCDFYRFSMENSMGNLDKKFSDNGYKYTNNSSESIIWRNQSVIHIFFGDLVSVQFRRDVRYNWRHIFATFGGLLGLFAGFSLMSILEFIYFFIISVIKDACINRSNTKNTN
ncbi:sodium channel protein Nach [Colletes latitarsis]|uniref:sodium channel protein Nach n=1 Tax=Colletes latitarsis TaxID=2605962 RepID=UPI0040362B5B